MALSSHLKLQDLKAFNFLDFLEYDLVLYFRHAILGSKKYLLGESEENLPAAKKKYRMMKVLDTIVKTFAYCFVFYMIFIKYDIFGITSNILCNILRCSKKINYN